MLKLGDKSLIVSHIQIVLKENEIDTMNLPDETKPYYKTPLQVTGIYDIKTFICVCLYMNMLYQNEEFFTIADNTNYREALDELSKDVSDDASLADLEDRVIAYFLGSVVSDISSKDDVLLVQEIMNDKLDYTISTYTAGEFNSITDVLKELQHWYGIKETGYYDPLTEKAIYTYSDIGR